jgi:hypothetical protein
VPGGSTFYAVECMSKRKQTMSPKNLFIDIETGVNLHAAFSSGYNLNLPPESIIKERKIISAAYKWGHEKKIHSLSWNPKTESCKELVKSLISVMNEADQIIGQNHRKFDMKWIRTMALFYKLDIPPTYKTVDTLALFKKYFYFNSNKQDYVSKFLTGDGKLSTNFDLWKKVCIDKNPKSLNYMVKYNKKDVQDLENIYNIIKPYIESELHVGVLNDQPKWSCSACGSLQVRHYKQKISAAGSVSHTMKCKEVKCSSYYSISSASYKKYLNI